MWFPFNSQKVTLLQDPLLYAFYPPKRIESKTSGQAFGLLASFIFEKLLPVLLDELYEAIYIFASFIVRSRGPHSPGLRQKYIETLSIISVTLWLNKLLRVDMGSYTTLFIWEQEFLFLNNRLRNSSVQQNLMLISWKQPIGTSYILVNESIHNCISLISRSVPFLFTLKRSGKKINWKNLQTSRNNTFFF